MGKRFNFTYELSFDEKANWTDITGFIDSRQTQIEKPAMSGEFKSSVGTCSFQVSYKKGIGDQMERHAALFASLVEAKMSNSRVWFHLLRNNNAIFTGTVDLSGLSQDVSNRPEWIQLTAYNNIRLLDENMKTAFEFCPDPFLYRDKDGNEVVYHSDDGKWYYKNSTIEYKGTRYPMFKLDTLWPVFKCDASDVSDDIVVQILLSQGWELSDINFAASEPILTSDGQSLRRSFAPYDPGKSERTARNYLDSLLHDNLAYLTTDGDGRFVVKRYKMTESKLSNIKGISRYLKNSRKLNIGGAIWNKDGIKLTWASLSAMKAKVYDASFSASISYGTDADGNETDELVQGGYDMPGHTYWPETGDLEEVWFDFSSDWLDRQYLCRITSKRNEDMMLMSTKNLDIDAQREPDIVLAELDGGASDNPTIMPLRMRTLFYNNSSAAKKFTRYKVYADCLYRAKVNTMVCPEMSEDYDEYTSEFIFSEENASEYARGMYNLRHYGSMVYKWVQKEEANPGDIWVVSPKDTNISTKVFVTNVTITFENGETWYTVDALGVSAYNSEPLAKKSISIGATEASKGDKGDSSIWKHGTALWGESTARGAAGNVDDYYLNDETMNLYRCITAGNSSTAVWQYVGCIKGDDASFDGTAFTIEYALSSSDKLCIFNGIYGNANGVFGKAGSAYGFLNDIWTENIDGWYRGLYIWQRVKTTKPDGTVVYGTPMYDKVLTESYLASATVGIALNPKEYRINRRSKGQQLIAMVVDVKGLKGELTISSPDYQGVPLFYNILDNTLSTSVVLPISGTTSIAAYRLTIPYNTVGNTITVKASLVGSESINGVATPYTVESTTTITGVNETGEAVQLLTVNTIDDMPTDVNVPGQLLNENIIKGDYIIVQYKKVTNNTLSLDDESFDAKWTYFTRELSQGVYVMVEAVGISGFSPGVTYYRFKPTPYMFDSTGWAVTDAKNVVISTVSEVVALARQQSNVDYHENLYVYEGYMDNLTAGIINVGDLFVNNIESANFEEDSDGFPKSGYRLTARTGLIQSVGSQFKNSNIFGILDLTKTVNGVLRSKAEIIHPALTTVAAVTGASSPSSYPPSATHWSIQDLAALLVANRWYKDASGTFNSDPVTEVGYVRSLAAFKDEAVAITLNAIGSSSGGTYVDNAYQYTAVNGTSVSISGTCLYDGGGIYGDISTTRKVVIKKNGVEVYSRSEYSDFAFSYALSVSVGDVITIGTNKINGMLSEAGRTYEEAGFTDVGLWLVADGNLVGFAADAALEETTNALILSSPVSFRSSNNVRYRSCTDFISYANTYCPDAGTPYSASGNSFYYWDGSSMVLQPVTHVIRNSQTSITLITSTNVQITMESGFYYPYNGTFQIMTSDEGVKTKSMYPREPNTETVGFSTRKYLEGNFVNINNDRFDGKTINCNQINVVSST